MKWNHTWIWIALFALTGCKTLEGVLDSTRPIAQSTQSESKKVITVIPLSRSQAEKVPTETIERAKIHHPKSLVTPGCQVREPSSAQTLTKNDTQADCTTHEKHSHSHDF